MSEFPRQLCTFHTANLFLGIDVMAVQEVLLVRELTRVSLASATIEGLLNLRGQIVTTIDLRKRLGLPSVAITQDTMFVIVSKDDEHVAFVVDGVGNVIDVDESTFELPPDNLPAHARGMIRGIHKLEGTLLHLLDPAMASQLQAV
ncbi:MAG: chemotaxis protein CheW [Candidatus Synoicihabitans palmerolidicus]|nr:chemotaxis protein CheW [Candidatus Synoicihabitans palmerolidicus]